jgi:signal transduction histidine kinase/DNA-binding response OmpR family regulator/ligand-binding sensor domain-containing protein
MTNRTQFIRGGKGRLLPWLLVFLFPLCISAQTYRYLGVEEGLSSHRIYRIQKDRQGYLWFLTSEGMDRYDGHAVKRYPWTDAFDATPETMTLLLDAQQLPWLVSREGEILHYDRRTDAWIPYVYSAQLAHQRGAGEEPVYAWMGAHDELWLFTSQRATVLALQSGSVCSFAAPWKAPVTAVEALSDSLLAVGTERGVALWRRTPKGFVKVERRALAQVDSRVDELFYHAASGRLAMANFKAGVLLYEVNRDAFVPLQGCLEDTEVHQMVLRDASLLLLATGGKGVYGLQLDKGVLAPYLEADYNSANGMNANNLRDLYVDERKRLWMACFDAGVTVQDPSYTAYQSIRHGRRNPQSLINDRIHDVLEDSDGDLWFATANGISLYRTKERTWQSFFSSFDPHQKGNHIFLTLCEVRPGLVWAGGLASGIYQLQKSDRGGGKLAPIYCQEMLMNQYIYELYRDQRGVIWSGGDRNLKSIDPATHEVRCYEGLSQVVTLAERDSLSLWVGTEQGLFLLQRGSGSIQPIRLTEKPLSVTALYPVGRDSLYVATKGAGLFLYQARLQRTLRHYHKENSALLTNQIYAMLPNGKGDFFLGTKCGLSLFSPKQGVFSNWTGDRGLVTTCFNTGAATIYQGNRVVFGGTNGAVCFPLSMQLPKEEPTRLLLRNLSLSYQSTYPGEPGSPLTQELDSVASLVLSHRQRTFSLEMTSINYDYPSNVLYSWRIKELKGPWSPPSADGHLFVQNLPAGHYTLEMRALSKEEPYRVLDERRLALTMRPAPWASFWAYALYLMLAVGAVCFLLRVARLRRQKRQAEERRQFYLQTAHEIRTPLTLVKAPMEELLAQEPLRKEGVQQVRLALKQVDSMLQLVDRLMTYERAESYGCALRVTQRELNAYLQEIYETFLPLAEAHSLTLCFVPLAQPLLVWFDGEKMDSMLKNLLSNAFKYSCPGGTVTLTAFTVRKEWGIRVTDTGSGIPPEEQKKLFRTFFRGRNSVNGRVPGSGIGLMLVQKYASLHGGSVRVESRLEEGTTVQLLFPQEKRALLLRKALFVQGNEGVDSKGTHALEAMSVEPSGGTIEPLEPFNETLFETAPSGIFENVYSESEASANSERSEPRPRVLLVEDHEELRHYLAHCLSDVYEVKEAANGKEALAVVEEFAPDLVLSDVLMPEMSGDRLCAALKQNFATSHLPVVLLTALNDEKYQLKGLSVGADDYLTKPFAPAVLKARMANLLQNRERLRRKFASPESLPAEPPTDVLQRRDWDFVKEVNRCIEERMQQAEFNVDRLCELHHMSRTAFYSKLKALTGHAPSEHIRLVRLHRASQLLQEGYSVSEVADLCGFCDAKYFREVFKRYYGENPSEHGRKGSATSSPPVA